VLTAIAVVAPVQVLITLLLISVSDDQQATTQSSNAQAGALWVAILLYAVVGLIVTALATHTVANAYVGADMAQGVSRRSPFAVLALVAIVSVLSAAGLALCIIPGLLLLALWAAAIPVMRLEGTGVFRSMRRSQQLAGSHYLLNLALISAALALWLILTWAIGIAASEWVNHGASRTSALIAQGCGDVFANAITTPLIAAAIVVCYFDARIRSEAFDLQLKLLQSAPDLAPAQ
jgi:hypothetical protein